MRFRDAMKKKGAEMRLMRLQNQADIRNMTKEKIGEIAKKHGVLIAVNDEFKEEIEELQKKYDIPKSRIITEELTESDVLSKGKVDRSKLGQLLYQRVMMDKDETGGLLSLPDLLERVNTGELKGKVDLKDVKKAIKHLEKQNSIHGVEELDSGLIIVSFFPVRYTGDQSRILQVVPKTGVITTAEVCKKLDWSRDRAERALDSLEKTGLAKVTESFREGKKYFFPELSK